LIEPVGAARRQIEGEQAELIRIDGVAKSFGDKLALRNVSFSVPAGQICGLLGPNGAGKTTLFRLLMGILKATAGKLLIDDLDTFVDRVQVMRLIGFLPDEPVFFPICLAGKSSN
jgi:ABC-type multidrug transport system ATPase subunit